MSFLVWYSYLRLPQQPATTKERTRAELSHLPSAVHQVFLCNFPVLMAKENKNASRANEVDARNEILKASPYKALTAFSNSGDSSRSANTDLRSFATS